MDSSKRTVRTDYGNGVYGFTDMPGSDADVLKKAILQGKRAK